MITQETFWDGYEDCVFFPDRIAFADFLLAVVKCVCLQVHLAKDLSRKLLWQMFLKGDFLLIFKIDHPNAESVEIHLELLVFDFCWECQTGFRRGFCLQSVRCHLPLAVLGFGDPRILRRVQASLEDWR